VVGREHITRSRTPAGTWASRFPTESVCGPPLFGRKPPALGPLLTWPWFFPFHVYKFTTRTTGTIDPSEKPRASTTMELAITGHNLEPRSVVDLSIGRYLPYFSNKFLRVETYAEIGALYLYYYYYYYYL
jgi:hypothetical protein